MDIATIDVLLLCDGILNIINYDIDKQSSMAIFDNKGDIVSKAEYDIIKGSDRGRTNVYGCLVTGQSGVIQGLHIICTTILWQLYTPMETVAH